MKFIKKILFLSVFVLVANLAIAVTPTSFLPKEDGYYMLRDDAAYGASIESIKPFRQPLTINNHESPIFLGSTDVLICVLLLGVYFAFTHKKSQTRNIDL
ncbi:hypothetical protein [Viscerimonas tarda]